MSSACYIHQQLENRKNHDVIYGSNWLKVLVLERRTEVVGRFFVAEFLLLRFAENRTDFFVKDKSILLCLLWFFAMVLRLVVPANSRGRLD